MNLLIKAKSLTEEYFVEKCFITEILNSNEHPTVSISQAKVKPEVTTVLHRLKETEEKYFVLSGTGEMEIGGSIVGSVAAGDMVIIPKNRSQRIKNTGVVDLIFLCICTPKFDSGNYEAI